MDEDESTSAATQPLLSALQLSNHRVWLLAIGRLLCQTGSGLLNFYIPLVFVNQVGLSATAVGFSIGIGSLAEVAGHVVGGALADTPRFGRKLTLLVSIVLGAIVSFLLVVTNSLPLLFFACLLLGFGVGIYWTAADAAMMDVTAPEDRSQAFAIATVADNIGTGIGVLGGGLLLLRVSQTPQLVFVGCGLIFLVFLGAQLFMPETRQADVGSEKTAVQGMMVALKDKALLILFLANALLTTYIAIVSSTVPLYFTNFIPLDRTPNASVDNVANLFTWCYIGVGTVVQLPIAHFFSGFQHVRVLMLSMVMWAVGFLLLWTTGTVATAQLGWGIAALCTMSIAATLHKPYVAAIVSELAPPALRGAYVGVNSQSWAIGFFIGPALGGWAMDQPQIIADSTWLIAAATTFAGLLILYVLERIGTESSLDQVTDPESSLS
ncbi:MAG: MFS transporter [Stenomitos rutilans HA7619-LM2]|jgi:MFS family permease|nr:MFS transporter [Stenomitos rutilans HA7619-LM2]